VFPTTTAAVRMNRAPEPHNPWPLNQFIARVVTLAGVLQQSVCPFELGGQDGQADEHDRPARARVRDGDEARAQYGQSEDSQPRMR